MSIPGYFSWENIKKVTAPPVQYRGTLRVVGTIGHCIGPDGKRVAAPAAVQEMMNRAASLRSREIRDTN